MITNELIEEINNTISSFIEKNPPYVYDLKIGVDPDGKPVIDLKYVEQMPIKELEAKLKGILQEIVDANNQ